MPQNPYESPQPQQPAENSSTQPANQYATPPQSTPSYSASGIISIILAVIAAITSFIPIVNNVSFFVALVALLFGIVGIVGISRGKRRGKGITVAGIVLSILSFVIVLASQSFYGDVLDEATGNTDSDATSTEQVEQETASGEESETVDTSETTADSPAYAVTIDDARSAEDYEGNPVIVVTYTFTNNSRICSMSLSMPKRFRTAFSSKRPSETIGTRKTE